MSEAKVRSVEGNTLPTTELPPLRFVTAASLFDGHDASINIMRRILQSLGVEVIHLAHNRSVAEVVQAALQEDVQGIAISSYQGGHVEYFKYIVDMLKENNAGHIKVFGGGGGVIVPEEIPAFAMTTSGTPTDRINSSATARIARGSPTSALKLHTVPRRSLANKSSLSNRLERRPSATPSLENSLAKASPKPLEAPVMKIVFMASPLTAFVFQSIL